MMAVQIKNHLRKQEEALFDFSADSGIVQIECGQRECLQSKSNMNCCQKRSKKTSRCDELSIHISSPTKDKDMRDLKGSSGSINIQEILRTFKLTPTSTRPMGWSLFPVSQN